MKVAVNELKGPRSQIRREVRPIVKGAVFLDATGDINAREFFVDGQLDVGISLIIAEQNVVLGLVLLDEIVFQGQRFHFVVHHNEFHVRDLGSQLIQFEIVAA